jgi:hypothetical protein
MGVGAIYLALALILFAHQLFPAGLSKPSWWP